LPRYAGDYSLKISFETLSCRRRLVSLKADRMIGNVRTFGQHPKIYNTDRCKSVTFKLVFDNINDIHNFKNEDSM